MTYRVPDTEAHLRELHEMSEKFKNADYSITKAMVDDPRIPTYHVEIVGPGGMKVAGYCSSVTIDYINYYIESSNYLSLMLYDYAAGVAYSHSINTHKVWDIRITRANAPRVESTTRYSIPSEIPLEYDKRG